MILDNLSILFRIAWRNLWRRTRRTLLTVGTVALGLALLLVTLGLGDGSHEQMIDSAVRMASGHVLFQREGYQELGELELRIAPRELEEIEGWVRDSGKSFGVEAAAIRVFASGLASSADGSSGIRLIGVRPGQEAAVSILDEKVESGRFLEAAEADRVVIGKGVAQNLEVEVEDKIVLMVQPVEGSEIGSRLVRVGGILETGLDEVDQVLVLMNLDGAQEFLELDGAVHQMALYLSHSRETGALLEAARRRFNGIEVLGWDDALPELRDAILVDDGGSYVFHVFIFLLIAFTVMNTLLMSVLERMREFSLLDALGLSPGRRFWMVMLEACLISLLAGGIGFLVGFSGHLYLHYYGLPMDAFVSGEMNMGGVMIDPVLYSELSGSRIFGAIATVFLLTLGLAFLPALRAVRAGDIHLLGSR